MKQNCLFTTLFVLVYSFTYAQCSFDNETQNANSLSLLMTQEEQKFDSITNDLSIKVSSIPINNSPNNLSKIEKGVNVKKLRLGNFQERVIEPFSKGEISNSIFFEILEGWDKNTLPIILTNQLHYKNPIFAKDNDVFKRFMKVYTKHCIDAPYKILITQRPKEYKALAIDSILSQCKTGSSSFTYRLLSRVYHELEENEKLDLLECVLSSVLKGNKISLYTSKGFPDPILFNLVNNNISLQESTKKILISYLKNVNNKKSIPRVLKYYLSEASENEINDICNYRLTVLRQLNTTDYNEQERIFNRFFLEHYAKSNKIKSISLISEIFTKNNHLPSDSRQEEKLKRYNNNYGLQALNKISRDCKLEQTVRNRIYSLLVKTRLDTFNNEYVQQYCEIFYNLYPGYNVNELKKQLVFFKNANSNLFKSISNYNLPIYADQIEEYIKYINSIGISTDHLDKLTVEQFKLDHLEVRSSSLIFELLDFIGVIIDAEHRASHFIPYNRIIGNYLQKTKVNTECPEIQLSFTFRKIKIEQYETHEYTLVARVGDLYFTKMTNGNNWDFDAIESLINSTLKNTNCDKRFVSIYSSKLNHRFSLCVRPGQAKLLEDKFDFTILNK